MGVGDAAGRRGVEVPVVLMGDDDEGFERLLAPNLSWVCDRNCVSVLDSTRISVFSETRFSIIRHLQGLNGSKPVYVCCLISVLNLT